MMNGFRQMHIPPALGAEFLRTFIRMEHALRASGEFADGEVNEISLAWSRFANTIDTAFCNVADQEFQAAVDFLLSAPTRKQILTGFGSLALDPKWTKADRTMLVIRTVRNNVIHGGKSQPEGEKEAGRKERLVASSLAVPKYVAERHERVRSAFYG